MRNNNEPLLKDDEPIFNRLSWSNLKAIGAVAATAAAAIAAISVTQNQIAENARRIESVGTRIDRNEAADHVRDSMLTVINYERARGLYPVAPVPPKAREGLFMTLANTEAKAARRDRDHTAVATLRGDFLCPSSTNSAGWSKVEQSPRDSAAVGGER